MKIVAISNFTDETKAEILIAENVHKDYIVEIIDLLNSKHFSKYSTYYIVAKEDDYKLWRGIEELV